MSTLTFRLDQLIRELATKKQRDYEKTYIAEKSGISRATISAIANNTSTRVDLATLASLLDFFAAEGMPVEVGDLFTVTKG